MTWSERFAAYLEKHDLTDLAFSHRMKVSASQVHYWRHHTTPREKTRKRIEAMTGGEVPADGKAPPLRKSAPSSPPPRAA